MLFHYQMKGIAPIGLLLVRHGKAERSSKIPVTRKAEGIKFKLSGYVGKDIENAQGYPVYFFAIVDKVN